MIVSFDCDFTVLGRGLTKYRRRGKTVLSTQNLPRGRVTWVQVTRVWVTQVRTIKFMTRLCPSLGLDLGLFDSSPNVKSGPWFSEICLI